MISRGPTVQLSPHLFCKTCLILCKFNSASRFNMPKISFLSQIETIFLLLRNKKRLISMAPFFAAARQPKRRAEKIASALLRLFFIYGRAATLRAAPLIRLVFFSEEKPLPSAPLRPDSICILLGSPLFFHRNRRPT